MKNKGEGKWKGQCEPWTRRKTGLDLEKAWEKSFPRRGRSPWDTEFNVFSSKKKQDQHGRHMDKQGAEGERCSGMVRDQVIQGHQGLVGSSKTILKAIRMHQRVLMM